MKVEIIINNVWSRIRNLQDIEIIDYLDKATSFYVSGYQYTQAFRTGWYDKHSGKFRHWDGKRHLLTNKLVFPTGLLNHIEKFFKLHKIDYELMDNRPIFECDPIPIHHYIPRHYQKKAFENLIKNNGGMCRMATGSGKTLLAAMLVAHYNLPSMIYVIGKDLLYQFYEEMKVILNCDIGIIGDGTCQIEKFNVCSVWTAAKAFGIKKNIFLDDGEDWTPEIFKLNSEQKQMIKKTIEQSNVAIFDEAHYLATDTLQSIYKVGKNCRYKVALSGSLWRDDNSDLLLESVCGSIVYNLPASKLITEDFLVPPKITFIDVPPLREEPKTYQSIYKHYISENPIRNQLIVDAAKILIKKGRRLLILVRYLSHGKLLAEMLKEFPLFFVNGEIDGETRIQVKKAFERGEYSCLIASSVFDIGIDIRCLNALILGGGGKSTIRTVQRIGRVIRTAENKKDALVVDFIDNIKYLYRHSLIRMAVYNTEPKFQLKFPKTFDPKNIKKIKKEVERVK